MTIGIFDTGYGGQLVHQRLTKLLPHAEFIVISDLANLPYGDKSKADIIKLTETAIQPLLKSCPIIVLACNTATATAIEHLRARYPKTQFVGFEPMIKTASEISQSRQIISLATAATRQAERYQHLVTNFATNLKITEPDTKAWASQIEAGHSEQIDLNSVESAINAGADVVILACTHYLALEPKLRRILPARVQIIEPTEAVARQIKRLNY